MFHLAAGMYNSRMVPAAEISPYFRKGQPCHLSCEIHRHLPWVSYLAGPFFSFHFSRPYVKIIRHFLLDKRGCYFFRVLCAYVFQRLFCQREVYLFILQRGVRDKLDKAAFQLSYIGLYVLRYEIQYLLTQLYAITLRLFFENSDTGFKIRRLDICNKAPFKP